MAKNEAESVQRKVRRKGRNRDIGQNGTGERKAEKTSSEDSPATNEDRKMKNKRAGFNTPTMKTKINSEGEESN